MSMLRCDECERVVDSDDDPDGFYVPARPNQFICKHCRDNLNLPTEFEE